MRSSFLILFVLSFLLSCTEEEPIQLEDTIDEELIVYFEQFALEAQIRGIEILWEEEALSASLTSIEEDAVGQCLTYTGGVRKINIDREYWLKSSTVDKEFLVFHELGHCMLGRAHIDDTLANGSCISIMSSGEDSCRKNYNSNTRASYLDELFSKN